MRIPHIATTAHARVDARLDRVGTKLDWVGARLDPYYMIRSQDTATGLYHEAISFSIVMSVLAIVNKDSLKNDLSTSINA